MHIQLIYEVTAINRHARAATAGRRRGVYLGGAKDDTSTLPSSSGGRQLTEASRSVRSTTA
jgi:hypothetical protein